VSLRAPENWVIGGVQLDSGSPSNRWKLAFKVDHHTQAPQADDEQTSTLHHSIATAKFAPCTIKKRTFRGKRSCLKGILNQKLKTAFLMLSNGEPGGGEAIS
jgi:hypothetical protein